MKALRGVSIVVLILWLVFSVAAVIVGVGRRRETLRAIGIGLIAAGAVALLTRTLAGAVCHDAIDANDREQHTEESESRREAPRWRCRTDRHGAWLLGS